MAKLTFGNGEKYVLGFYHDKTNTLEFFGDDSFSTNVYDKKKKLIEVVTYFSKRNYNFNVFKLEKLPVKFELKVTETLIME